jgi:hypothetical protein
MQLKRNINTDISNALFGRLSTQGMIAVEIPRFIRDVCKIIGDGGIFTLAIINQELERLGWSEGIMDQITLELIIFFLQSEYGYEVQTHTLH